MASDVDLHQNDLKKSQNNFEWILNFVNEERVTEEKEFWVTLNVYPYPFSLIAWKVTKNFKEPSFLERKIVLIE